MCQVRAPRPPPPACIILLLSFPFIRALRPTIHEAVLMVGKYEMHTNTNTNANTITTHARDVGKGMRFTVACMVSSDHCDARLTGTWCHWIHSPASALELKLCTNYFMGNAKHHVSFITNFAPLYVLKYRPAAARARAGPVCRSACRVGLVSARVAS